jgi:Na+(H+)/acetate symporter ActP
MIVSPTDADIAARAIVPFSQPGIVTIPLGFAVLVAASWMTRHRKVC